MPKNTIENSPENLIGFIPRGGYDQLLEDMGWNNVVIYPIPSDASNRRYFRISAGDKNAILMDAPPELEDVNAFIKIARHLKGLGFSAPEIFGENIADGFLLLEDLGKETFTVSLQKGIDEKKLYALGVDALAALHNIASEKTSPPWLEKYSNKKLLLEASLLPDWYMPGVGINISDTERKKYDALWLEVLPKAHSTNPTLVLRDFHVDNLVLLDERPGVNACGLLDFQDGVSGHPAYDLMSLLEDARRDISPELKTEMLARYHEKTATKNIDDFARAFAILGAGRHAKVIGIFTRLFVRDNKPVYLKHISRVWGLLEQSLLHPDLTNLKNWFDKNVPLEKRITPGNESL